MSQVFTQEQKNLASNRQQDVHTALPGRIVSYDAAKGTATVQPIGKYRKPNGEKIDFPQVMSVPVHFSQAAGQGVSIGYPIKAGDECMLMFAEQTLDTWRTGAESETDLRFDLANCMAVPGLFAKANPVMAEAQAQDALILDRGGTRITIFPDNRVEIKADVKIIGKLEVEEDAYVKGDVKNDGDMTTGGTHTDTIGKHDTHP